MPQALEIDRDKVKMVAIQVGVREAARAFDLPEATVQAWSRRDGWMKEVAETQAFIQERVPVHPLSTKSPSEVIKRYGERSKLRLSKTVDKTALHLSKQTPPELLCNTQALVNTVNAASKLHNWQTPTNQALVNINLTGVRYEEGK